MDAIVLMGDFLKRASKRVTRRLACLTEANLRGTHARVEGLLTPQHRHRVGLANLQAVIRALHPAGSTVRRRSPAAPSCSSGPALDDLELTGSVWCI